MPKWILATTSRSLPECQVHYGKEASTPWQAPINSQSSGLPTAGFLPGKPPAAHGNQGAEWRSSGSPSSKDPGPCHHQLLSFDGTVRGRKDGRSSENNGVRMQVLGKVLVR